ncbi:MAG: cation:proton antiporter [Bacteroidia bacterium]|jgi:CPA2 family monovalent cation:H+ antiporter-2|nr:cation:proton antiporter [Bacteroidia bacterium]
MNHVPHLISDLALILLAAAFVTLLFKWLKQPVVLGYIIAGLLVSPNFTLFPSVTELKSIQIWAEIGVIFMLFSLGLEFSFKKLLKVGSTATITGLFEITCMLLLGFGVGQALAWSKIDSLFLGGIIAISSTTIIFRAFDELNIKTNKFASLVIGVLVIEDLVAVLLLVLLSTVAVSPTVEGSELVGSIVKLLFFLVLWFISGIFLLPTFLKKASRLMSDETTLIVAIGLCLGMVLLAAGVGFSAALGAFIMGSLLAETTHAERIEHVFKPVKDLFGAIFFVSVGMLINPEVLYAHIGPVLAITLAVVLGKLLFVTIGALLSGQPLNHAIQAGTSMAQIGEFSFIIATLGLTLGVTGSFLYPIAVGVSVITTFATPYMIKLADPLYNWLVKHLPQRWTNSLNRYSAGTQQIKAESDWKVVFTAFTQVMVINSVLIVAIILIFKNVIEPVFWISGSVGSFVVALLALAAISPFWWMLTAKKINKPSYTQLWLNKNNRGPIIMLEILRVSIGIILIGVLFVQFFSTAIAFSLAAGIMLIVGFVFSRKLHAFTLRIEKRFYHNLYLRESMQPKSVVSHLLPWDAHLAYVDIEPNSDWLGKPLGALQLREQYGINIAMIERGNQTLMVPGKTERLYPYDRIALIGTDEQITQFKEALAATAVPQTQTLAVSAVALVQFKVNPGFVYLGKSIRESALRERSQGLVVGIERNGQRYLNPESTWVFELDDVVWIVGDESKIKALY